MLCSKLHYQKGFNVNPFLYTITCPLRANRSTADPNPTRFLAGSDIYIYIYIYTHLSVEVESRGSMPVPCPREAARIPVFGFRFEP